MSAIKLVVFTRSPLLLSLSLPSLLIRIVIQLIRIGNQSTWIDYSYRKNDLKLIITPEKQDKTLELSKHWSADSTPARNEVIMKRTYPVKSVKCDKICSNY